MNLYLLVGALGLGTGFLSGLVGIGGGIIMAPLLLYVPPLFGFEPLPMRDVAGLTIVQGLVACVAGAISHNRFKFVSAKLTWYMGGTILIFAALGGAGASLVSNRVLLSIFACLALIAGVLIFITPKQDSENPSLAEFEFSRLRAVTTAGAVGLLGGLVGQGGSFILIPLMTSFINVPTRIAIGSNLAIVFFSSLAGFLSKAVTGQIPWLLALPIIITVIPAASLGSLASRHIPIKKLRLILAVIIVLAAVRIGISAIFSY